MIDLPEPPEKLKWSALRVWFRQVRRAILTNRARAGDNISTDEHVDDCTVINADVSKIRASLPIGVDVALASFGDLSLGETEVDNVKLITFDSRYFIIHDAGGGEVQVSLKTTTCS